MFSDSSRAPAPGEQRGFKPHAPHFIPWLRNSLKPHHHGGSGGGDPGLNGPYRSNPEARRGSLTPLERAKGIGLFSIQGRDRAKKGELRCNGVGMARMLPVVLRGHHILPGGLGKRRGDSPARQSQSPPELDPNVRTISAGEGDGPQGNACTSAQNNHTSVRNHSSSDDSSTSVRKYGPLVGPPPVPDLAVPAEEPKYKVPAVACVEDRRGGTAWDYRSHTLRQRDLRSSGWASSEARGLRERRDGLGSCSISGGSQSHRDLTALRDPPVERFNGPLNGIVFSTEVPRRGPGCTATLRGPRKPRPSSELVPGQNQTWVQHRVTDVEERSRGKEAGCHRRAVRNQIKRVVQNLEQVLVALRDVQQEMKEVVQQIDHLTSSIDLNEEEQRTRGGDSSSGSSSSEVTVHRMNSEPEDQPGTTHSSGTLRRDHCARSQSPPNVLLCPVNSGFSSERTRTLRFTNNLPPSTKSSNPPQPNLTSHDLTLSPQRSLPVRPPTPGLSPLTVSLHHSSSPGSQPHSPGQCSSFRVSPVSPPSPLSPKPHPPPALSPSVIVDTKVWSYQTPQSDHPSAGPLCPSVTQPPSASRPPTDSETQPASNADRERRASSAGPVQAAAKPPTAQGRRGRKPPPYPHHKLAEKVKEPRKAPPYPEKRRLLSTTV